MNTFYIAHQYLSTIQQQLRKSHVEKIKSKKMLNSRKIFIFYFTISGALYHCPIFTLRFYSISSWIYGIFSVVSLVKLILTPAQKVFVVTMKQQDYFRLV